MEKVKENFMILLAEDDTNLGELLTEYLEIKGHMVKLARNGMEALQNYNDKPSAWDLLILDVMMPEMDGFSVAREIREKDKDVPIIFLTAKGQKEDIIEGFESGADDYLSKPFSMEELLLRVKAILRRTAQKDRTENEQKLFHLGNLVFDYELQMLRGDGRERKLSTKEAELLRMLCLNKNDVLLREMALKEIWGGDDYFTARSMDVYITKLRKYLKPEPNVQIMNVHGKGYKLLEVEP